MAISRNTAMFFSALIVLLCNFASVESRPSKRPESCPICTDQDRANCPVIVASATCTVIDEPNCGCCKVCAGLIGDYCHIGHPPCLDSLVCLPSLDDEVRQRHVQICMERIPDDVYELYESQLNDSDSDSELKEDYDAYLSQYYSEDDVAVPSLMPVDMPREPLTPLTPPTAPYPNDRSPCRRHSKEVGQQRRFKRHQWVPACDYRKGRKYGAEQCEMTFGLVVGRCWCVDKRGIPISGFMHRAESSTTKCNKMRRRAK